MLLTIGAVAAWHWAAALDPITITAAIAQYPAAPVWFVAVHLAASLLLVPRSLLAVVAGMLFGLGWGLVWGELGGVAGAAAGFLIARYINSGLVDLGRVAQFRPVLERAERGGWRAVAVLRLIPIIPHGVANYGLALTRLGLGAYAFGSLVGQLPMTIAYVELGAAGQQVFIGGAGWVAPTLIGLAALSRSLIIPAYSRWRPR